MTQRTREMGGFYSLTSRSLWWTTPPYTVTSDNTKTVLEAHGNHRSMTDVVVPNFRKRMEEGEIINNPMTSVDETRVLGDGGFLLTKKVGSVTYWGEIQQNWMARAYGLPALPDWPDLSHLVAEASTKAHAKVQAGDFSALVSGAEFHKTLKMMLKPASSIQQLMNRWYRRYGGPATSKNRISRYLQWSDPLQVTEALVGSWMEYRYGWRVLMLELEGLHEALSGVSKRRNVARASCSDHDAYSVDTVGTAAGISQTYSTSFTVEAEVSAGILYDNFLSYDEYGWGVRASDIPAALWDLVPYSFVVDWVLNTNAYFQGITAKAGIDPLATWVKEVVHLSSKRTSGAVYLSGWTTVRSPNAVETRTLKSVRRTPHLPSPSITWNSGFFRKISESARSVDAAAILFQQLAKALTGSRRSTSSRL